MNKRFLTLYCILTIRVHAKEMLEDNNGKIECNSKLHIVDLAGLEYAKTAISLQKSSRMSEVAHERETRMNINCSLLTLRYIISILKEQNIFVFHIVKRTKIFF